MLANPIVEAHKEAEKEWSEKQGVYLPFQICCVTDPGEEGGNPQLKQVRDFCLESKIPFYSRTYDTFKFWEDCNYISSLPAFHIYDKRKNYERTFYPKDRAIQEIQTRILEWKEEQRQKERKAAARKERVARLLSFFENLSFRRKPVLQVPLKPKKMNKPAAVPVAYGDTISKAKN